MKNRIFSNSRLKCDIFVRQSDHIHPSWKIFGMDIVYDSRKKVEEFEEFVNFREIQDSGWQILASLLAASHWAYLAYLQRLDKIYNSRFNFVSLSSTVTTNYDKLRNRP